MPVRIPRTKSIDFAAWFAERDRIDEELRRTPEAHEKRRDRLLDRSYELERLIFETESQELSAIRVKARLLLWLMTIERADGLSAMRHIQAYLET
jgi:hypothetical protein